MQQANLSADKTQVLILHPRTLAEVLDSIVVIGRAAGVADRAQQLVEQLQGRLQAVAAVVQAKCPAAVAATTARASTAVNGSQAGKLSKQPASSSCVEQTAKQPRRTAAAAAAVQNPGAAAFSLQQQQEEEEDSGQGSEAEWQRAPRVLSLEGLNPLVLGGQWLPDVKLAAGAVDASGQQPGDPPTRITWEQVCVSQMYDHVAFLVSLSQQEVQI
jgi:Tfp pilus assembly major pilin PilA